MPEVMEVEVCQSCDHTGPFEAMSHVIPPMPGVIVKDPWDIQSGS